MDVARSDVFECVWPERFLPAHSSERWRLLASGVEQDIALVVAPNSFAPADQIDRGAAAVGVDGHAVARWDSSFQHADKLIFRKNDVIWTCGDDGIQFWRPS